MHQKDRLHSRAHWQSSVVITVLTAVICSLPITAAILPEDRADALFHQYKGGGVTIKGPSFLARKQFGNHTSVAANYYVDMVTSASIDVISQGSPYTEKRKEYSVALDFLYDKTNLGFAYGKSKESDYEAKSYHFSISHGMFGDLTTVSLGYSQGDDNVGRNAYQGGVIVDTFYVGTIDRYQYRFGLSQILTKKLIMDLGYEIISDEGETLNNPYRSAHIIRDPLNPRREFIEERYPNTRNSNALALRAMYYLPYRAAIRADARYFSDSWDISAITAKLGYSHPFKFKGEWLIDLHYRFYSQSAASFYADAFLQEQLFMGRDKELSTFTSNTIGVGISYMWPKRWWKIDKGSLNFSLNHIQFDYENFQETPNLNDPATWKPYSFAANVLQMYVSIWY